MKITLALLFAIYFLFFVCYQEKDGFKVDAYNKYQYSDNLLTNDFDSIMDIKDRFQKGLSYERDLGVTDKDHKGDTKFHYHSQK